jgi:hypothetical protein
MIPSDSRPFILRSLFVTTIFVVISSVCLVWHACTADLPVVIGEDSENADPRSIGYLAQLRLFRRKPSHIMRYRRRTPELIDATGNPRDTNPQSSLDDVSDYRKRLAHVTNILALPASQRPGYLSKLARGARDSVEFELFLKHIDVDDELRSRIVFATDSSVARNQFRRYLASPRRQSEQKKFDLFLTPVVLRALQDRRGNMTETENG